MMQDAEKEWRSLQNRGISCCSCDYSLPMRQVSFFLIWVCSWEDRQRMWTQSRQTAQFSFFTRDPHPEISHAWSNMVLSPHSHLPRSSWSICPFIRNPPLLSVLFHIACTRKFFFSCVILEIWVFYSKVPPTWDPWGTHWALQNQVQHLLHDRQERWSNQAQQCSFLSVLCSLSLLLTILLLLFSYWRTRVQTTCNICTDIFSLPTCFWRHTHATTTNHFTSQEKSS